MKLELHRQVLFDATKSAERQDRDLMSGSVQQQSMGRAGGGDFCFLESKKKHQSLRKGQKGSLSTSLSTNRDSNESCTSWPWLDIKEER